MPDDNSLFNENVSFCLLPLIVDWLTKIDQRENKKKNGQVLLITSQTQGNNNKGVEEEKKTFFYS